MYKMIPELQYKIAQIHDLSQLKLNIKGVTPV